MPARLDRIISIEVERNIEMSNVLKSDCTWTVTLEIMKEYTSTYSRAIPISSVIIIPRESKYLSRYTLKKYIRIYIYIITNSDYSSSSQMLLC